MENKYNSQMELFNKLKPALRTKRHELERKNIKFIREIDIWNYNKENIWAKARGLTIAGMVNHILNTDDKKYEEYCLKKMKERDNNG